MPTNLEIESSHSKRPIREVAQELQLDPEVVLPHGHYIAKVPITEPPAMRKRYDKKRDVYRLDVT